MEPLNDIQSSILTQLRHRESARFSELMHPTGLTSDSFKFHLRKLMKLGHITKTPEGRYMLSISGETFANDLDEAGKTPVIRPKLSIFLIVESRNDDGAPVFLFQTRKRNPYYGYTGVISGPVGWGEPFEASAKRELFKQAGCSAEFRVQSFCRVRDYDASSKELLEDKLFVVMYTRTSSAHLSNNWHGGKNHWLTLDQVDKKQPLFPATTETIRRSMAGERYMDQDQRYQRQAY